MSEASLAARSSSDLVALAIAQNERFKDVIAVLDARSPDDGAAAEVIAAFRAGKVPPWLAAVLLGRLRAPSGYAVTREILLAGPGLMAEGYAACAMARIANVDAFDDLASALTDGATRRIREGAASGLVLVPPREDRPDPAELLLRAALAQRISASCAGRVVTSLPHAFAVVVSWFGREDEKVEPIAFDAGADLLRSRRGGMQPRVTLARCLRTSLERGRVRMSPHTRAQVEEAVERALAQARR